MQNGRIWTMKIPLVILCMCWRYVEPNLMCYARYYVVDGNHVIDVTWWNKSNHSNTAPNYAQLTSVRCMKMRQYYATIVSRFSWIHFWLKTGMTTNIDCNGPKLTNLKRQIFVATISVAPNVMRSVAYSVRSVSSINLCQCRMQVKFEVMHHL